MLRSSSPPPSKIKTQKESHSSFNSAISEHSTSNGVRPRSQSLSTGRDRTNSVSEVQVIGNKTGKFEPKRMKTLHIGKGFNIVDGSVCRRVLDRIRAQFTDGNGQRPKHLHYLDNYEQYETEMCNQIGVEQAMHKGAFSLSKDSEFMPFLCGVEDLPQNLHYFMVSLEEHFSLKMETNEIGKTPVILEAHEEFKQLKFGPDTKDFFYRFITNFGTHYISEITFGAKAELRWSFSVSKHADDAFKDIKRTLFYQQEFQKLGNIWEQNKWSGDPKVQGGAQVDFPKHYSMAYKKTGDFTRFSDDPKPKSSPVGFKVTEISTLFQEPTRKEMSIAVRQYIEDMRPKVTETLFDGEAVCILCMDNRLFVRCDSSGGIYADKDKEICDHNQFVVRKKGDKIALRSKRYGKYLSKALMRSTFHFQILQIMGPHETFEVHGHYLTVLSNLGGPSFLELSEEGEVHHHASYHKKNRFVLLDVAARNIMLSKEPIQEEKEVIVEEPQSVPEHRGHHPPHLTIVKPFDKNTPKANSTNSLFIKDTISLPDLDELTKSMAMAIHDLLRHHVFVSDIKKIDIFDENLHPFTSDEVDTKRIPSVEAIFHFLSTIFKVQKLPPEPGIMAMIYFNRVLATTGMTLLPSNWRRLILSCLILSSKVWEDAAVWNVDFIDLFPSLSVKDLNRLEQHILGVLDFSVAIKSSEYVSMYFDLRRNTTERAEFVKPLDDTGIQKLELRTSKHEIDSKKEGRLYHSYSSTDLRGQDLSGKPITSLIRTPSIYENEKH